MVPKVIFQIGIPESDFSFISGALKSDKNRWYDKVLKRYPKLVEFAPYTEAREQDLRRFVENEYSNNKGRISESITRYQSEWDKKNDAFMKALYSALDAKEPEEAITIRGLVGVNPIFPRWWEKWEFYISYGYDGFIGTTAHEVVHMVYFRKLIDEFPEIDTKTFDGGHKEWRLSEVLDPIILNDPRIAGVIGDTKLSTYACTNEVLMKFNEVYQKHLNDKTNFIDFYNEAKKLADETL